MQYPRCWKSVAAALWLALTLAGTLPAQEVIVGPLTLLPGQSLDESPVLKRNPSVEFPRDMRQAGEIGYVIVITYLDATGKARSRWVEGTVHPYTRAVQEVDDWKIQPARKAGATVDAQIWLPVIFNPPGSSAKLADATPRLLHVTPVVGPGKDSGGKGAPETIRVSLTINEQGEPEKIQVGPGVDAALQPVVAAALQQWKFAPARKAGRPVAATLELPVIVQPPFAKKITQGTPPKPISQRPPVYPPAMLSSGLIGEVAVEFTVDPEGRITEVSVLESNNPGFNEAAIEAVRKWKFKPALMEGKAVATKAKQVIVFDLPGHGQDAFTVQRGKKSGSTAADGVDVPPKPRGTVLPVYPYELLRDHVKGSADVRMVINEKGRVIGVTVQQATHPAFGLALAAAVQAYAFDPALKQGKAVPSTLSMTYKFDPDAVSEENLELLERERRQADSIVSPSSMAEVPQMITQRAPTYPAELEQAGESGQAVIEFLIDREGRPRLPRVITATRPAFGYAAVQAIADWRFAEPRIKGKSAILSVRLPMNFTPATK
jgi:TonB family protein